MLRTMPKWTAFYEPLNPRCWFDPARRGDWVDSTHRRIPDYWAEYEDLDIDRMRSLWSSSWDRVDLLLQSDSYEPDLHAYLSAIISHSDQCVCLQFNRVDFRLTWLRESFPGSRIVHLIRNPRDQWCSTYQQTDPPNHSANLLDLERSDEFYLRIWAEDLQRTFPALQLWPNAHPYQLSYAIWQLSYSYGFSNRDFEIRYEDLVQQPRSVVESMMIATGHQVAEQWQPPAVDDRSVGRWMRYADDNWFCEREQEVDEFLDRYVFEN
ncbi:sulfotransferase [Stieleria varia]